MYGEGFGLHLGLSLLRGDGLNWHWRQWPIVVDTILVVAALIDVANIFPSESCLLSELGFRSVSLVAVYWIFLRMNAHCITAIWIK